MYIHIMRVVLNINQIHIFAKQISHQTVYKCDLLTEQIA